ncbi:Plant calmodulin-binding protein-like protein [Rhynchospora pubera]|uniref:Plant calmodulin-binding protein-like protein n=1 Tax=Rhynchospora pubera TaxID=906938 RepID=A0AAV8DZD0_9POAL|nr:Plant calmodulin-binding protein-like protein [Rhynchospora pubera]
MVQRKEPTKLKPKTKQSSKPHSFDLHESPISKGTTCSDNTKMKARKYFPNYMKPTSSSDARKDQQQVTHRNSPSITNSSRNSNRKSSSPPSVTSKRKSLTPLLKRNKSKVLFQKLNLNRATCSSTLKDSKFPKALDLNPGGTESEGTSVMRVCPYTYCSLNGHVHEPMPPLKSFLASKRKLIKTQQSMKLKGFSPFRKREPKRIEKEVPPLIQEVVNDFIVEIYASTKEKIADPVTTEERTSGSQDSKREEEEAVSTALDLKSDFSVEEMDAMVKLVEYVSCDHEVGAISEKCSDLEGEDVVKEELSASFYENITKFESFKEFDMDFMEDLDVFSDSESFSSGRTDGGSDRSQDHLVELKTKLVDEDVHLSVASEFGIQNQMGIVSTQEGDEEAQEDQKLNFLVDLEERSNGTESESLPVRKDDEIPEVEPFECSDSETPSHLIENVSDKGYSAEAESVPEREDEKISKIEMADLSENENATQLLENGSEAKGEDEDEESKTSEVKEPDSILEVLEEGKDKEEEIEISGTDSDREKEVKTELQQPEDNVIDTLIGAESGLQAVEDESHDPNQTKQETIVTETSKIDQLCAAFSELRIEGEDFSFDPTCQQKNRLIIARRRPMNGEDEYMRGFNPRAPNFLPVEPDPESEKVDLRHQTMDERKNAEEYLIDYALRKAVDQLAPARSKKVELLVAAFEKVVPVQGGPVTCS